MSTHERPTARARELENSSSDGAFSILSRRSRFCIRTMEAAYDFDAAVQRLKRGDSTLRAIVLRDTSNTVDEQDVQQLARLLSAGPTLSQVTSLDISENVNVGDAAAQALASALRRDRRLRSLSMCNCHIGDRGATALAAALGAGASKSPSPARTARLRLPAGGAASLGINGH